MTTQLQPAVSVDELVHDFGTTRAVDGVTFAVAPGEIFGLLGPNGAGKTTTIRVLLTLLRPTAGRVAVAGMDVADNSASVRRSVGWVPQERTTDPLLTARENLTFTAGLYHLHPRAGRRRADELLSLVGLAEHGDRLARDLSGGMRRRLELAAGLVHLPSVLFLDEPTLGLDISARRLLWEHVAEVRRAGTTVLLTTHYLDEADALCDRVAIIHHGRVRALGAPESLKRRYGHATVHLDLPGEPDGVTNGVTDRAADGVTGGVIDGVVGQLRRLAPVGTVTTRGTALTVTTHDPVMATEAALAACRRAGVTPRDLWTRRASLDDVFLSRTGHALHDGTPTDDGERP